MDNSSDQLRAIDESSLRQYFRRVLEVSPGSGRKQIRQSRDRISGRLRERLLQAQGEERERLERAMVLVNTAFDCLSNNERFTDYFNRVNSGEIDVFTPQEMPPELGPPIKPPPRKQVERRQAHTVERMERIASLIADAVRSAGAEEAHRQTKTDGRLPDADVFYETIYDVARNAGRRVKKEELAEAEKSGKYNLDDECVKELDAVIEDTAEIVAHKEYDRLEYMAAQLPPPQAKNKVTALVLAGLILFLVGFYGWYAMTQGPVMVQKAGSDSANPGQIMPNSYDSTQTEVMFDPGYSVPPLKTLSVIDKLVSTAGFAGLCGSASDPSKAGASAFESGLKSARAGNNAEAINYFSESAKFDDCKAEALYCMGVLQGDAGRFDEAIDSYSKALIKNPAFSQAYYNRALCHHVLANSLLRVADNELKEKCSRHLQSAVKNYGLALRVDPRLSQCLYNRAWTYYLLGRNGDAINDLDAAAKISSMLTAAEYNRNLIINALNPAANVPIAAVPPQPPVGPVGPPGP